MKGEFYFMAIYDIDAIREQEAAIDEDTFLDGMLEACSAMMDALGESTAAQRHFGTTTKDRQNLERFLKWNHYEDISPRQLRKDARDLADPELSKDLKSVEQIKKENPEMSIRDIEKARVETIADHKGYMGALMAKHAQHGHDVKGEFDKIHKRNAKKKAIKETCLTILSVIDDI